MTDVVRVPSVRTRRLLLRGWQDADLQPFAAMNADPRVTEFLSTQLTREESDALVDRFVNDWADDGFGIWAIERLDDGVLLGFTGLARPRFEAHFTPAVEVGWRLAADAWGNGYANEAARAALRYGFEVIGLDEIVSFTVPATRGRVPSWNASACHAIPWTTSTTLACRKAIVCAATCCIGSAARAGAPASGSMTSE